MDLLPPETIINVISYLNQEDLITCACISREFQYAAERVTFASVNIKSTDFDKIEKIFGQGHRRSSLRHITFQTILPKYKVHCYGRIERESDQHENNKVFSQAVIELLQLVNRWNLLNQIELTLHAWSPSDIHRRPRVKRPENDYDIRENRFKRSFLIINHPEALPDIKHILALRTPPSHWRNILPETVVELAKKMPNLNQINWSFSDDEKYSPYLSGRRERRLKFAQAISQIHLAQLTSLELNFKYEEPNNHGWRPHPIMGSRDKQSDILSVALYNITTRATNLRDFHFDGPMVCSTEILWPTAIEGSSNKQATNAITGYSIPYWPKLEKFRIVVSAVSPEGEWIYELGPGTPQDTPGTPEPSWSDGDRESLYITDSDPEIAQDRVVSFQERVESRDKPICSYRDLLRQDVFENWTEVMALSVKHMPRLKTALLAFPTNAIYDPRIGAVEIECRAIQESGKEWEFQLTQKNRGLQLTDKLKSFVHESTARTDAILIHSPDYSTLSRRYLDI